MKIQWSAFIFLLVFSGCASTKYTWHGYDATLYRHYKMPQDSERFIESLGKIVLAGEKKNNVPPGLYAEYAYVLYEAKRYDEAVVYFAKEHDKWPESRVLMSKMLASAKGNIAKTETKDVQP